LATDHRDGELDGARTFTCVVPVGTLLSFGALDPLPHLEAIVAIRQELTA
jgi:hypothetical protein